MPPLPPCEDDEDEEKEEEEEEEEEADRLDLRGGGGSLTNGREYRDCVGFEDTL